MNDTRQIERPTPIAAKAPADRFEARLDELSRNIRRPVTRRDSLFARARSALQPQEA